MNEEKKGDFKSEDQENFPVSNTKPKPKERMGIKLKRMKVSWARMCEGLEVLCSLVCYRK